jgi:hypothetical protein
MARRKTVKPSAPPKVSPKARLILATTVRQFYEANVIRATQGHCSTRDGHRFAVDASGRAVLSGTAADPVEWLTEIEHRIVACADREERSARFIPDHTRICRENGKLSWDGASAYRPIKKR